MNREEYIEHILAHKNIKRQSAVSSYNCLARVLRHCKKPPEIPRDASWVDSSILKALETLPNTPQKNLSSSLMVYLRICNGTEAQLKETGEVLQKCSEIQENAYMKL